MDDVRSYYQLKSAENKVTIIQYDDIENCIKYIKDSIDLSKKSAILVRKNRIAEKLSTLLEDYGMEFVYLPPSPLDYTENESEHIWIAREIAFYLLKERFAEYNVMEDIPEPEAYELRNIRHLFNDIKDLHDKREDLRVLVKIYINILDISFLKKLLKKLKCCLE